MSVLVHERPIPILNPCEHDDKPKEECGIFGIYEENTNVSRTAFFALFSLQHRGQEGAGLVSSDGSQFYSHRGSGLVSQIFDEDSISKLKGPRILGHTRYSTTGKTMGVNTQPFVVDTKYGPFALAHNGQLARGRDLRRNLMNSGIGMFTTSDSECIIHYILKEYGNEGEEPDWEGRIMRLMGEFSGAYSCIMMTLNTLILFRDPHGLRPLCLGRMDKVQGDELFSNGGMATDNGQGSRGWVAASESCALSTIGAIFVRDIRPGEIVRIDSNGIKSVFFNGVSNHSFCIFEYVYFARPDSVLEGRLVHSVRQNMGKYLAIESPVPNADIVLGVPDSSTPIAIGYSNTTGIPYTEGLTKNRYIARTFIQPDKKSRVSNVELKYNTLPQNIMNKVVVLIDDSIVRGTTSVQLVSLLRRSGAKEIHLRIASPPVKHSCYMGVDMSTTKELIAANYTIEEIKKLLNADSLAYLSHHNLLKAIDDSITSFPNLEQHTPPYMNKFCSACFTGDYPLDVDFW